MNNDLNPLLDKIRIVLIGTTHPGNIGSAIRAMKTMGLSQLILVDPVRKPDYQTEYMAANAADLLSNIKVVKTVEEAIADCTVVVGTSARSRTLPWPMLTPKETASELLSTASHGEVAVIFGREHSGLTNEELQMCDYHVQIPANPNYPVLNLAMAVQVIVYEIFQVAQGTASQSLDTVHDEKATAGDISSFYAHLSDTLTDIGFLDPDNPKMVLPRLKRMFARIQLEKMEMRLLRGILRMVQDKIK